jgi:hypothetical protein
MVNSNVLGTSEADMERSKYRMYAMVLVIPTAALVGWLAAGFQETSDETREQPREETTEPDIRRSRNRQPAAVPATTQFAIESPVDEIPNGAYHDELFAQAPFAWRTAGAAIAEVTNRWQCDPRWSFFSLKNDRKLGKAAVLWSKYLYPGDLELDFNVAIKMEQERGPPYTYARDINVTICSDGVDLNKGYTFMFGGYGNASSMILRNGIEVSRHPAKIPTEMNMERHRGWFTFRIEKQGGRLSFRVNNFFASSKGSDWVYEDPQPLTGNRIAIWTYDNAIMLSRVHLSGEGGREMEHPNWQPGPLKTPLDGK